MNIDSIKKEAKLIMDNFMDSLNNIQVENEFNLIRSKSYRTEDSQDNDEDFRNIFLFNAPKSTGDTILANKGEWTKK